MRTVFADAGYWIALISPRDNLHQLAINAKRQLGNVRIITTQMVFTELLDGASNRGASQRAAVAEFTAKLATLDGITIVPQTSDQFSEALDFYRNRPDKEWSLTDCASMLVCQELGITEVLTYDNHFVQAGYVALLRK